MELLTLLLRLIHIVGGAFWAGSAISMAAFLTPAAAAAGPEAGRFMRRLGETRLPIVTSSAVSAALLVIAVVTMAIARYV